MRAQAVVEPSPFGNEDLRLLQRVEDVAVEELISELAVERLDVAVLPGRARLDEQRRYAELTEPVGVQKSGSLKPPWRDTR